LQDGESYDATPNAQALPAYYIIRLKQIGVTNMTEARKYMNGLSENILLKIMKINITTMWSLPANTPQTRDSLLFSHQNK
jgi:hypothetical protein